MNLFVGLRHALVAITFIASPIRHAEGGVLSVARSGECPIATEDQPTAYSVLRDEVEDCFTGITQSSSLNRLLIDTNATREQIRAAFANYCRSGPELGRCLDGAKSKSDACLNETQRTRFRLLRQYKELVYEVACGDNAGGDLAYTFEEVGKLGDRFPDGCYDNATAETIRTKRPDDGPNGDMAFEYAASCRVLECLERHRGQGHDPLVEMMTSKGAQTMDGMKCVQGDMEVLCKNIL